MTAPAQRTRTNLLLFGLVGLLACQSAETGGEPVEPLAARPDQVVARVRTTLTDSMGVRRGLVIADSGFVFQADQRIEFTNITATLFDARGDQAARVTGQRGNYSVPTGLLTLEGAVSVSLTRGGQLTAPALSYDVRAMRFRTDSAYSFESPSGKMNGTGFDAGVTLQELRRKQPGPAAP